MDLPKSANDNILLKDDSAFTYSFDNYKLACFSTTSIYTNGYYGKGSGIMAAHTLHLISGQIRAYLIQNILFSDSSVHFSDDESLLEAGIVDSAAVMELVMFFEETFGITIEDYEIIPDNFDSVTKQAKFISNKLAMKA